MAAHLLIQILLQIGLGLLHRRIKRWGAGSPHIQQIDGVIQHRLDIQPGFAVRIHPAEGPQGHLQVVIEAIDGFIQHIQVH